VERSTDTQVAVVVDPTETEVVIEETPEDTEVPTPEDTDVPVGTVTVTGTVEATLEPTATLSSPEDNWVIAFASDRSGSIQIWLYYFETGELVQLTNKLRGACQPDFSPDGTYLVYISPCTSRADQYLDARLYVIPVDDPGDERRLETVPGTYEPAWSPVDENQILYVRYVDAISTAIYRYDLETDQAVQMTQPGNYLNYSPAWAPDGETYAFISTRQGGARIYVMENEPLSEARLLTRSGLLTNGFPSYSPDGRGLLFSGRIPDDATSTSSIYLVELSMLDVVDVADYFEEKISLVNVPEVDPEYSPDGAWIVLESWPGGLYHDIYIMNAEGGEKQPIDSNPALDFDPTWMPVAP
jgi:Tol biopolymer transport system component